MATLDSLVIAASADMAENPEKIKVIQKIVDKAINKAIRKTMATAELMDGDKNINSVHLVVALAAKMQRESESIRESLNIPPLALKKGTTNADKNKTPAISTSYH